VSGSLPWAISPLPEPRSVCFVSYGDAYYDAGPPFFPGWQDLGGEIPISRTGCSGFCTASNIECYRSWFRGSVWEVWPQN
jgi:hypothetical protein